jgi:MscS family membrane protein
VAAKLRPLTWVGTCWLFFKFPAWLDLPVTWLNTILPARTFLMAGLIGWLGFQMIDLLTAMYTNSEFLRPHRSLSDMIVPVCMRLFKGMVFLLVLGYVIYHVGHGESLIRFLTGLGMAGLAASLAAQDILKSVFGTMLLIGERSFKLGDRIKVDGHDGVVEQVGFRSTRLRTPDGSLVTIPNSTITSSSILRIAQEMELRRAG